MAMLLLKPAPIYILDEVDAALDLSHTQNIGSMLKNHFKKSQFIIVSLKDGMFENANVLYRTKFVDGVSTVTRVAAAQRKRYLRLYLTFQGLLDLLIISHEEKNPSQARPTKKMFLESGKIMFSQFNEIITSSLYYLLPHNLHSKCH